MNKSSTFSPQSLKMRHQRVSSAMNAKFGRGGKKSGFLYPQMTLGGRNRAQSPRKLAKGATLGEGGFDNSRGSSQPGSNMISREEVSSQKHSTGSLSGVRLSGQIN